MIYCILGQTASGKTSLALSLARKFSLPIISADAYQCYKVMQVGTDKPTRKEVEGLSYYFYDEYEPDQEMSVFLFQQREVVGVFGQLLQRLLRVKIKIVIDPVESVLNKKEQQH